MVAVAVVVGVVASFGGEVVFGLVEFVGGFVDVLADAVVAFAEGFGEFAGEVFDEFGGGFDDSAEMCSMAVWLSPRW